MHAILATKTTITARITYSDGGSVAIVAVDTSKRLAAHGRDTRDGHSPLGHGVTVAAGAVELAKVIDGEVFDADFAAGVVLDDLVIGALGSTADDAVGAAAFLEGEGVYIEHLLAKWCIRLSGENRHTFAHRLPPDVLYSASTLAVHTLDLVRANDGVLESTTLLDDEDGVAFATLALAGTFNTTTVRLHASVEDIGDFLGLVKGLAALGVRKGEGVALGQVTVGASMDSSEGAGGKEREEKAFLIHVGACKEEYGFQNLEDS